MPQQNPFTNSEMPFSNLDINNIQEVAMQMVHAFCTIVSMPIEYALRPFFGSQYFPAPLAFFSMLMMLLLPAFFGITQTVVQMIPFVHVPPPTAPIGLGTLSKWFFIGCLLHGIRIWRRMLKMDSEQNSRFEGPALRFFTLLPRASFWMIRIAWEPAFVIVLASFLSRANILQGIAATYLEFAAFCLLVKNFISWHKCWRFFRDRLDIIYAGRIVAQMTGNRASQRDMDTIHMAAFPKDVAPDMKRSALAHMARLFHNPQEQADEN